MVFFCTTRALISGLVAAQLWCSVLVLAEASTGAATTVPGAYIIEFEDGEDSGGFFDHVGATARTHTTFDHVMFRGASIQFHDLKTAQKRAEDLQSLPVVKMVWPLNTYPVPDYEVLWASDIGKTNSSSEKRRIRASAHPPHVMTQINKLHANGFTGSGVKIGIIDTGIDYNHPALGGGCYGPGCLVSYGYDLVGDFYNGHNRPTPDEDPYEACIGHGSHVAGIIAAQDNDAGFSGAAPGATLGMYRVFGCSGNVADDVMIEAFIRAFEDGSDIITASLGSPSGWNERPWGLLVSRIVAAGVPCTISSGNDGSQGLFYIGAPADAKGATAVAAFDNLKLPILVDTSYYSVGGAIYQPFSWVPGRPYAWANDHLPIFAPSLDLNDTSGGCTPFNDESGNLTGHIVLLRRGGCPFEDKAANAKAAGAKHVLFYNNDNGNGIMSADALGSGVDAVGMVTADQGAEWIHMLAAGSQIQLYMRQGPQSAIWRDATTGGFPSPSSSWGPTFEMDIKPQAAAPGSNILSTYPLKKGSYAVLSGTSMATPLMAAIIALISNVRGTLDPSTITNLLVTNANPQLLFDGSIRGMLAPVAQQGGGLVQAYDAAYATTLINVPGLAFNDSDHLTSLEFTIKNTGPSSVTYVLGTAGAATAYTFSGSKYPEGFPGMSFDKSYALIHFNETVITVAAGHSASVLVTATPPPVDLIRLPVWSGYITINGTNGENLSLAYQGVAGSLHSVEQLDEPYVTTSADKYSRPIDGLESFILHRNGKNEVVPQAAVPLYFGSAYVNVEAIVDGCIDESSYNSTCSIGNIVDMPATYQSRSLDEKPHVYPWSGEMASGDFALAGRYKFKVSVLKIFGNRDNPDDWVIAETSSAFNISYY